MSRADRLHDLCFFIFWYNDCDDFLFFLNRDAEDDSRFSGTGSADLLSIVPPVAPCSARGVHDSVTVSLIDCYKYHSMCNWFTHLFHFLFNFFAV